MKKKHPKPLTREQIEQLYEVYWIESVWPKPGEDGSNMRREAWFTNRATFIDAYLAGRKAGRKEGKK